MSEENGELDFDDLTINTNRGQSQRVKAFADQRRKLKPNRRHAASRNPVKVLTEREDVNTQLSTDEENEVEENVKINNKVEKVNGNAKVVGKLVGRHTSLGVGKIKAREHALTGDAKKGLETKEDIGRASKALRTTEKDKRTGVGTEKTNPYDGIKNVMFFHIKGGRHVQTRLVEAKTTSMNSGDVFLLVTPKYVHQWNGKNCSIMEKSRGAEVVSVVQQWKELGCNSTTINLMDEGREKPSAMTSAFWKILGDKKLIKKIDNVLDDKEYEKAILQSNKFYEIQCSDEEKEACSLKLIDEHSGKVPSKKWLDSNKAYVLDFGTEVYSWIGRLAKGAVRKKAVDIGLQHFQNEYETCTEVHPFDLNARNAHVNEPLKRPSWAVYGRMAEKTENVAFRRKFYDWPDPVDLKVKTVDAQVHAQLTKGFSNEQPAAADLLQPVPAKLLTHPTPEPNMILDGMFIGRGKGMRDEETLFRYGVTLNELTVWQVSDSNFEPLPKQKYGTFYSGEAYIIKWSLEIFRTGIRSLKGGASRQDDQGKDRVVFFFWQGADCSSSDRGTAALMTVDLDTEEGPQILVEQGNEPPTFYQLFDGKMIVHSGKSSEQSPNKQSRLYWIRNEVDCETCIVEVSLTSASLRSRGCFILVTKDKLLLWKGGKAVANTRDIAQNSIKNFSKTLNMSNIVELDEGDETSAFWDAFGDEKDYMSYIETHKEFEFTPRCFVFDSIHGHFQHKEVASSSFHPDHVCPFPMMQHDLLTLSQPGLAFIDNEHRMYLWQGWWPEGGEAESPGGPQTKAEKHRFDVNRRLAMQSIKAYANALNRDFSRAYIIHAGSEPLEFTNLFPAWNTDLIPKPDDVIEKQNLQEVLKKLEKSEYTLEELITQPLPEGVDPTRIEDYLSKQEFQKMFKVTREEYNKLPRWKQIDMKKKTCLF